MVMIPKDEQGQAPLMVHMNRGVAIVAQGIKAYHA